MKDIKDYLHLYLGCEVLAKFPKGNFVCRLVGYFNHEYESCKLWYNGGLSNWPIEGFKLLLRPLSDMTEEEFKEYAHPKSFASYDGYWYACDREIDPDFDGELIEFINDACDDDPENVIMCHVKSKYISYGWIEYEERYHGFGVKEEAEWVRFLLSKGFDLFGLIEAGLALDKTKHP